MTQTLTAAVAIAALSTLGDFIWATWLPEHRAVYGFAHGLLLFCAVGLVFGLLAGRPAAAALAGAAIGAAAAGTYYVVSPLFGYAAMFVVWFVVWIALAWMYARLSATAAPAGAVLARGVAAATASGLAFYLISGIWRPFDPQGWDYAVHFAAWTFAYFPGFAALLLTRTR
ncbi:MAG: hypothetical protein HYU37_20935 [Acidobacteria bacterium]|nr:hypothetical protein [Acidobacteriota bacterium]